jgi:hypothetical protein
MAMAQMTVRQRCESANEDNSASPPRRGKILARAALDPIHRGRDDQRNPCDRGGPLSLAYYWRAAVALAGWAQSPFADIRAAE